MVVVVVIAVCQFLLSLLCLVLLVSFCFCFSPFADNLVCIRRTPKAVVVVFLFLFRQLMLLLTDCFIHYYTDFYLDLLLINMISYRSLDLVIYSFTSSVYLVICSCSQLVIDLFIYTKSSLRHLLYIYIYMHRYNYHYSHSITSHPYLYPHRRVCECHFQFFSP